MKDAPRIAFLGICQRAAAVSGQDPYVREHNIIGLKQIVFLPFLPLSIAGANLALAIYDPLTFGRAKIRLRDPRGTELMTMEFHVGLRPRGLDPGVEPEFIPLPRSPSVLAPDCPEPVAHSTIPAVCPGWEVITATIPDSVPFLKEPGIYTVWLCTDTGEVPTGWLSFSTALAPPLTEDRIAAIRSDPLAAKAVRWSFHCNTCNEQLKTYAALERSTRAESDGWIWHGDLPPAFKCSCGANEFALGALRDNLHAALGRSRADGSGLSFTRLYEKRALEHICRGFGELLDRRSSEGVVQSFVQKNPILLHSFSPERVFFKSPILTKHQTDVVVLSHNKELCLIELERPGIKLLKKDGGIAAQLQHAFDQVRDWLHVTTDHRAAVLDCIGLKPEEVGAVRAVVIAGRNSGYDAEHLRKLKSTDFGRASFLTYDDILHGLVTLSQTVDSA
jgi:hypothetical protein